MASVLLVESGSTKTDWCLLPDKGKHVCYKTSGINPHLQSSDEIQSLLENELTWNYKKSNIRQIYFYGAGAGNLQLQSEIKQVLYSFFKIDNIEVAGDMMAAARSLCGSSKAITCILGTGSNSCYYDGKKIKEQQASLGYIAGDEGSGNHLGKRVLQYYAYKTFDEELTEAFEQLFGNDLSIHLNKIYKEPFPNRYLARFVELLVTNRGHYMVENIVEDCLTDFFHAHVFKYRQSWKLPIHFTGSVAWEFKDVLKNICRQYELELGSVEKAPLEGLIRFHKAQK